MNMPEAIVSVPSTRSFVEDVIAETVKRQVAAA
jgi:hypothetical protein